MQKKQLFGGVGRFVLITGSLFIFPWTFIAILGNGIPRIWANFKLRKISAEYADPAQKSDPVIKKEILSIVKRSLSGAVYYCVSGQITIWLVSIFGSTQSIAHIGAPGRLTTVLTLFTMLFNTIIIPRFARLTDNRKHLTTRFLQIQMALLGISIVIVFLVIAFPSQILWILGKEYTNLKIEVMLIAISG